MLGAGTLTISETAEEVLADAIAAARRQAPAKQPQRGMKQRRASDARTACSVGEPSSECVGACLVVGPVAVVVLAARCWPFDGLAKCRGRVPRQR